MTREFDCIEDIEEYYDEKSNTYVFMDDGRYIDLIIFNFNLKIDANIDACGIIQKIFQLTISALRILKLIILMLMISTLTILKLITLKLEI